MPQPRRCVIAQRGEGTGGRARRRAGSEAVVVEWGHMNRRDFARASLAAVWQKGADDDARAPEMIVIARKHALAQPRQPESRCTTSRLTLSRAPSLARASCRRRDAPGRSSGVVRDARVASRWRFGRSLCLRWSFSLAAT